MSDDAGVTIHVAMPAQDLDVWGRDAADAMGKAADLLWREASSAVATYTVVGSSSAARTGEAAQATGAAEASAGG